MAQAVAVEQLWTNVFPSSCTSQAAGAKRRSLLKLWGAKPDFFVKISHDLCTTGKHNVGNDLTFTERARDCVLCVRQNAGCPCGCYGQLLHMYDYNKDKLTDAVQLYVWL